MSKLLVVQWRRSRAFRVVLVLAVIYATVRLAIHGVTTAMMMTPAPTTEGMPDWATTQEPTAPVDLQIYIDAAKRFLDRQSLYPAADKIEVFQYAPAYALAFSPFLLLPPPALVVLQSLLHIAAYAGLYLVWGRIFRHLGLSRAAESLTAALPVWLVFSAFWSDLGYLNIYIIVAMLGSLFIEAVLTERMGLSILWLSLILQTKPHWAFAAVVPLLLGRYKFFFRLMGFAILGYLAVVGVTMAIAGPTYVVAQYTAYVRFMLTMSQSFPWRGPEAPFLGYNHAIKQIVFYVFGMTPAASRLAVGVKLLLLVPLALVSLRHTLHPVHQPGHAVPTLALDLAFAWYLGAFIWLDMVWELSLGIALYTYLLGTLQRRYLMALVRGVFLPYALVDLWQLTSVAVFGMQIIAPGLYVLTDPSIYVPVIMVVIVTFYTLLIGRLWRPAPVTQPVALGATAYGS